MTTEHQEVAPTDLASALRMTREMPWKAINELDRMLLLPLARLYVLGAGLRWGRGWRLYGLPIIQKHRRSELRIGDGLELRSTVRSNPLGPNRPCILSTRRANARLVIGDDFKMTGGSVVCEESITIGNRVTVGCNTII
ncbi:MAG TPA: hypothetical protein VK003_20865, partial [Oceanobacillus sp.]|nr:hypothetical protein [Oceanobacillus sp.]